MRGIIKVIVWIVYIVFAIYTLDKFARETGLISIVFGIPAAGIGAYAIHSMFQKNDDKSDMI